MKSDQVTIKKRVEEIFQLRLVGALPTDIRRHAEEQHWGVSERQLQRYTVMADEMLAEAVENNRDRLMAHHYAARRALYARAMAVSDYRTALAVMKDEAELLGLYAAKRTELSGPDGSPIQSVSAIVEMTDDERAAAINAILARLGQGHTGQASTGEADAPGPALGSAGTPDDGGRDDPGPLADGPAPLFP